MSSLKSRDARLKLHRSMVKDGQSGNISWESIGKGRSIGFRWLEGSATGNWYARLYDSNRAGSPYHRHAIGTADDVGTANGEDILNFSQALTKASSFDPWDLDGSGQVATVSDALNVYLEWSESNRPTSYDTIKSCFEVHIFPDEIAAIPVERLTIRHLEKWKTRLAKSPRQHVSGTEYAITTEDEKRSRKNSANRSVSWLRAALNYCKKHGFISCDDSAWRLLSLFKGVSSSARRGHAEYLSLDQVAALFEAIPDQCFLHLVQAAVWTGARYSELASMVVGDWDPANGSVTVADGKGGKRRNIFLGDFATRLWTQLCEGRQSDERIFLKSNGSVWGKNHQQQRFARAIRDAGIKPRISFHGLRSTYASQYLMAGGDMFGLMKQLGHSDTTMLVRHYGHLASQHRQDQAKACEPIIPGVTASPTSREATLH